MKIVNKTKFNTSDLRKIVQLSLTKFRSGEKGNPLVRKSYNVTFETHKGQGWTGGCAYYNSGHLTIKLPLKYAGHKLTFAQSIADVFFHEVGHCIGVKHNSGNDTIERYYRDWILKTITSDFKVNDVGKIIKDKVDIQLHRYNLVSKNIEKAKTRLKRAKTIFDKWQRKLVYYEKSLILVGKLPPKK
jgi:hypothetical protein